MKTTFFFYDLETSGLDAKNDRVMQFAGQRTDMDLQPIGEPLNILVKLSDDILPSPDAIMVTGITPQSTVQDGVLEPEFCQMLINEVFTPGTITVGFNNVRFDDEFIRHTLWRNFYDPYEWAYKDNRSRWDMLDVVRLTRALRPEGINWPVDDNGKAVNKLELLAKSNNLTHTNAHDALSDVEVLIDLSRLIKLKQPKLFAYLLKLRDKKQVSQVVSLDNPQMFVYASGRYDEQFAKTTVAYPISIGPKPNSILVYDLRHDPSAYAKLSPKDLAKLMFTPKDKQTDEALARPAVKELSINKCPAVAPIGVLDAQAAKNIALTSAQAQENLNKLLAQADFGDRMREAYELRQPYPAAVDVEAKLYDDFVPASDKPRLAAVRAADANELADFQPKFTDERLSDLLLRYKARSYPISLSESEQTAWGEYRQEKLAAAIEPYMNRLQQLNASGADDYLIEELKLWAESIIPSEAG